MSTTLSTTIVDESYDNYFGYYPQTVSIANTIFATEQDFTRLHNTPAGAWRNLPQGVIYHIMNVKRIATKTNKDAMILYLYQQNSVEPTICWACSLLATELKNMKEIKNLFLKSTGLKRSQTTGRDYFSYQLVQKN